MDAEATSRVSPLLALPGAVVADGPDAGVAAHYGKPLMEQRALAAGDAIVDLLEPRRAPGHRARPADAGSTRSPASA